MSDNTIRDFLVGIGFKVDEASYSNFGRAIETATLRAKLLGDAVESMGKAAVKAIADTAETFEQLYRQSESLQTTVAGVNSVAYALSQFGMSADAARSSIKGFGEWFKNNPGSEDYLKNIGVNARDAQGHLKDLSQVYLETVEAISKRRPLGQQPQIAANIGMGSIDPALTAERLHNAEVQRDYDQELKRQQDAGINQQSAAGEAKFMQELRETGQSFTDIMQGFELAITTYALPPLKQLNEFLSSHQQEIDSSLNNI